MGTPRLDRIDSASTSTEVERAGRNGNAPSPDIQWVLDELLKGDRRNNYIIYRGYYDGPGQKEMVSQDQLKTLFANMFKKFRFNLCSTVVDAVVDRLQVNSFTSEQETAQEEAEEEKNIQIANEGEDPEADVEEPPPPDERAAQDVEAAKREEMQARGEEPPPEEEQPDEELDDDIDAPADLKPSEVAWEIWRKNRMPRRLGHLLKEAVATGDAYLLVWPSPEGEPIMHPQGGHEVCVEYDKERPGTLKKAGKLWMTTVNVDGKDKDAWRITLYYPEKIEKFFAIKKDSGTAPQAGEFKTYSPTGDEDEESGWRINNQYGQVPIFHFANNADLNEYGRSELVDAVPIQDYANRTLWNLLAGDEAQGFPQRWILNIEDPRGEEDEMYRPDGSPKPIPAGVSRMLAFTGGDREDSHPPAIGQFPAADLNQMVGVSQHAAQLMAVTTGTPIHHFLPTMEGPSTPASGESQKTSDFKLQSKVEDRQESFGDALSRAMEFALKIHGEEFAPDVTDETMVGEEGEIRLDTNWKDLRPRNEKEQWEVAKIKQSAGVPWQQLLIEMGYTEMQIEKFKLQKQENAREFSPVSGETGTGRDPKDIMDELASQTGLAE